MLALNALALLVLALCGSNLQISSANDGFLVGTPLSAHFHIGLEHLENVKTSHLASTDDQFINQTVDHFKSGSGTFKQRYFVNTQYSNGTNSQVHILYLEGPYTASLQKAVNESYPHVANAKALKATVWVLEHRFHGKSRPFSASTNKNLAVLSTQQAVEDINTFIQTQNKISKESNPKWILYGSHYAGSLALWFRQTYPSLSVGVVTSSAPAVAAADFYRYEKNVEDAYAAYDKSCFEKIKKSAKTVRQYIQYKDGRSKLSSGLKLNPSFSELQLVGNDLQFFYVVLLNFIQLPVQFNKVNIGPFANGGGIQDVCKIFNNDDLEDFEKVTNLVSYMYSLFGVTWSKQNKIVPNDYNSLVKSLKATSDDDQKSAYAGSSRTFFWQQCNQLGYFTTTDYSGGIFGSAIPNNFWLNLCQDVFGRNFNVDNLKNGVRRLRKLYGSSSIYNGTNAFIVSGSQDPVRTLGYTAVTDSSSVFFNATGAAFTADQQPPCQNESYSLSSVRSAITKKLKQWVNGKRSRRSIPVSQSAKQAKQQPQMHEPVNWETEIDWNATYHHPQEHIGAKMPMKIFSRHRNVMGRILRQKLGDKAFHEARKAASGFIRTAAIKQRVDNFDPNNKATYSQFFFYNDKYEEKNGPIFLLLGGEGPIDQVFVGNTHVAIVSWASEYGAALYELEHRFYGRSIPTEDLSVDNLRLLTSQQALADAAVFINKINKDKNLTSDNKWIVFGGSYPGSLTAWIRLKYPNLVYGSVASSAPVQAKTDYFEYMQIVQNSTKAFGSQECVNNIHKFFAFMQQKMTTIEGRTGIASLFGLCNKWDGNWVEEKDPEFLIANFVMGMAGTVQYDDEQHRRMKQRCNWFKQLDDYLGAKVDTSNLKDNTNSTELFKDMRKKFGATLQKIAFGHARSDEGEDCTEFSYKMIVDEMSEINPYDTQERGWVWQTCNELGVAQSTNFGYNIFESALPVNHFIDMCRDIYGKDRDYIDAHVSYTNQYYGGQDNYNGTRCVFVNGEEDPWNALGMYNIKDKSVSSIFIAGSSHCEDMFMFEGQTSAIKKAHKAIHRTLNKWLN